jgi:hypothetical protein
MEVEVVAIIASLIGAVGSAVTTAIAALRAKRAAEAAEHAHGAAASAAEVRITVGDRTVDLSGKAPEDQEREIHELLRKRPPDDNGS